MESMKDDTYNRFKELRQSYYIAGRSLMVNELFDTAGINFGYAIELSLKFLLASNGHPQKELMKHHIKKYYEIVVDKGYINPLIVSDDFLTFMDERLNVRYPIMIANHLEKHKEENRVFLFTIDMLHCYDDFILQLDDAIISASSDPRTSIGFRCCRALDNVHGRIFFHCNDHAFSRIPQYQKILNENRDSGDNYDAVNLILSQPDQLWNFLGMMAYRPWGPKKEWFPAGEFVCPKNINNKISFQAAKWSANNSGIEMYISSSKLILPPGTYNYRIGETKIPDNTG